MNILGISAFYHDSAACLVQDGRLVAAAQEERFTRKKHDYRFPKHAIQYCLDTGGITPAQLDHVAFYDKPLLKFERLLETYCAYAPQGLKSFLQAMPLWLREKLFLPREMDAGLNKQYKGRYIFPEHHESHAASAFFPSPFEEAAILTLDGVGEWATASLGAGRGNRIEITHEMHFPHSLGLLYSAFTYYCGFRVNSGEYKLMGLAPYGEPKYVDLILDKLIDLKPDGSLRMDMRYFNYCQGFTMTSPAFDELFGAPARKPESQLTQRDMNLAASIQFVTEEAMLRSAHHLHALTGMKNLCLAGGVALNCVGNGRILREGPFENIWIQPAAGDAGGALGAALFVWHQLLDKPRTATGHDTQFGSLLGPNYDGNPSKSALDAVGAKYHVFDSETDVVSAIADALESEKVVGHMQGRMEFGPRALGSRSIIGDARSPRMQSVMNLKTKFRESFRPFAPCVLREYVDEYFEMRPNEDSPYMLLVAPVQESQRVGSENGEAVGLEKLKQIRSTVPAITHVDYSARVQTVDPVRHPRMHAVMSEFRRRTGCPVIINTSFNVRSEPIVCTPEDAYRCFMATNMDVLVVGDLVLYKEEQPSAREHEVDEYLAQFELD
ncbi:MAG: carbamoyltransferase [Phycisphaerales bacterium]|nr:carbamoyltransferase [Phycisphaerales bacterium]MCB9862224.1 carbamoyltransferase [Phycisphaerales bacterium]